MTCNCLRVRGRGRRGWQPPCQPVIFMGINATVVVTSFPWHCSPRGEKVRHWPLCWCPPLPLSISILKMWNVSEQSTEKTAAGFKMQGVSKKSRHFVAWTAIFVSSSEVPVGTGCFEKVNIKRCVEQKASAAVCSHGSYIHPAAAAELHILMLHLILISFCLKHTVSSRDWLSWSNHLYVWGKSNFHSKFNIKENSRRDTFTEAEVHEVWEPRGPHFLCAVQDVQQDVFCSLF